jgi:hypothetical protein
MKPKMPTEAYEGLRAVVVATIAALATTNAGCAAIAVATAPDKEARTEQSPAAREAAEHFWATLHEGRYDDIDAAIEEHMRVVVETPDDAVSVARVGWLHAWKAGERARKPRAATVVGHISLARRYFEEAVALNPDEARYLGFLASFTMTEGAIMKDEAKVREGYFMMGDAVDAFPEFNLFTSGYTMSGGSPQEDPFIEGLAQQWETLDVCFGEKVDRSDGSAAKYLGTETHTGPRRVCWNSEIAPHNWEGFFLNFGDMLVRAGDPVRAKTMYANAKLSRTYDAWPYRDVLERRMAATSTLAKTFATAKDGEPEHTSMVSSAFACMGCHQATGPSALAAIGRAGTTQP